MAQLIVLLVVLIGMMLLCLRTSKVAFVTPQFGFVACFIPGVVYAFSYVDKWDLQLTSSTVYVIVLGTITFVVASLLSGIVYKVFRKLKKSGYKLRVSFLRCESLSTWKFVIILFFQIITFVLLISFLIMNYGSSLSDAMFTYRRLSVSGEDYIVLPGLIKAMRRLCISAGFITSYIFTRSLVYREKKYIFISLICTAVSLLNGMALGARGDAILIISGGIIQYMLLYSIRTGGKTIKTISFIKIMALIVVMLLSFSEIGKLLGRNMSSLKFGDYLAVYMSAELKNLDTFVRTGVFGATLENSQTMANISRLLATILGNPSIDHRLSNPYRFINGYALGNVSTVYYGFLYDGGIPGVVLFTTIMAVICQISFRKAINTNIQNGISLSIVIYSYIWYTVVFSFFSDKFYEMIFNTTFIWFVVSAIVIKLFLHVRFKFDKHEVDSKKGNFTV